MNIGRKRVKTTKMPGRPGSKAVPAGCSLNIAATLHRELSLSARSSTDSSTEHPDSGIHGAAKKSERHDNSSRDQASCYRVFHNGQAILVFDELQYRRLDCLHNHFAHLIECCSSGEQHFMHCLLQH
jgi:hypothetical protein